MLFSQPLCPFSPFPTPQIHFRFHRLFFFASCPDLLDAVLLKAAALLQLTISSRSYHNAMFKDCKMLAAVVEKLSICTMLSESSIPPPQAELDPMPDIIQPSQLTSNGTLSMLPSFQAHTTDAFNSPRRTRELPIACQPLPPSTYPLSSERHSLGSFTVVCPSCSALHWMEERLARSSERSPKFGMCCNSGKISWPAMSDPPEPL
jgi:hypothetical protein